MNARAVGLVGVGVLAATAVAAPASAAPPERVKPGKPFTIALTGAAEVPGPGDPDASGTATLRVNPGLGRVCYTLSVEDVDGTIVGAHIHVGDVTESGPVVVPLVAPVDGRSAGCVTVDRELALDLIREPENYYVNVHSAPLYGPGAVRGQLG